MWNEIINSSDRNAVLIVGAAIDTLLERILRKFLLSNNSASKKLLEGQFQHLAPKIEVCYSLGLISVDERNDLNIIKEVRNAFAHNLFGCDFSNTLIINEVSKFKLAKKANTNPKAMKLRSYF